MRAAIANGTQLLMGNVTGLAFAGSRTAVRGVVVDDEEVEGDAVVVAMGPWSVLACRWLPLPAVYGLKGHSLVFRYAPPVRPHALFVELESETGAVASPEVIPPPRRKRLTSAACPVRRRFPWIRARSRRTMEDARRCAR